MKKSNFIKFGKSVIDLEIKALKKLKKNLNNSFNLAVEEIVKCKSKIIPVSYTHLRAHET